MAKFLFAIFLISISFKLLGEISVVSKDISFIQTAQDSKDTKSQKENIGKGEKEFNIIFHFLQLHHGNLLDIVLNIKLKHGEPFPGFTNAAFAPPDLTYS